jgi:hypothetical protein
VQLKFTLLLRLHLSCTYISSSKAPSSRLTPHSSSSLLGRPNSHSHSHPQRSSQPQPRCRFAWARTRSNFLRPPKRNAAGPVNRTRQRAQERRRAACLTWLTSFCTRTQPALPNTTTTSLFGTSPRIEHFSSTTPPPHLVVHRDASQLHFRYILGRGRIRLWSSPSFHSPRLTPRRRVLAPGQPAAAAHQ